MSISGFLTLGIALSGQVVVPPPAGTGYAPQPVSFDTAPGGVTLNGTSCVFGPVSGSWGVLTVFGVVDSVGNPYWAGTLSAPFAPVNGQLVIVPQGNIALVVGAQISASPAVSVPQRGATTSGSVTLSSGAYTAVLASGTRNAILLTNASQVDLVKIVLGGTSAPASGAAGFSLIPPYGSWPPPSMGSDFVPTDSIWALSSGTGTPLNWLVG